jgi:hypothetical protein
MASLRETRALDAALARIEGPLEAVLAEAIPGGRPEAATLMAALLATGATRQEALASLVLAAPLATLVPLVTGWIRAEAKRSAKRGGSPLGTLLAVVAKVSPALAAATVASPKLKGLHIKAGLRLPGATWLTTLPRNLQVDGVLDLACCTGLSELPEGLRVAGALRVNNCPNLVHLPADLTAAAVVIKKDRSNFEHLDTRECPDCGSPDDLYPLCSGADDDGRPVKEWAPLTDDGLPFNTIAGDSDWAGPCTCRACNFEGHIHQFEDFGPASFETAPDDTPWDGEVPPGVPEARVIT